jgi:hypothetical protein
MIERDDVWSRFEYRKDGKLHRVNGPAWYDKGSWAWFLNDKWHRYYGPQDNDSEWWVHGIMVK